MHPADAIYFRSILDIEPRLFQPIKQKGGVCFHNLFRLVDSRHGALEGRPAHPLGFGDVVADAALRSKLAPELESTPQSPFMGRFALAGVCEPVSLARCEGEGAIGQIELRRSPSCPRAYEPLSSAPEGLRRCLKLDPVVGLAALPVPSPRRARVLRKYRSMPRWTAWLPPQLIPNTLAISGASTSTCGATAW
jgi:hypothetical protein